MRSFLAPNSQIEGPWSVPTPQIEVASIKPAQEHYSALDDCFALVFEPLPSNPSPGPLRLGEAPAAGLSPRERAGIKNTSDSGPFPWGVGGERSAPGEGFLLFE